MSSIGDVSVEKILLIRRDDDFIAPRGETVLEAGDTMLVLADESGLGELHRIVAP